MVSSPPFPLIFVFCFCSCFFLCEVLGAVGVLVVGQVALVVGEWMGGRVG